MEDDRGMVMEFESMVCVQKLGRRKMLRFMRTGILVCVVVVLVVGVVFFGERSLPPCSLGPCLCAVYQKWCVEQIKPESKNG